MKFLRPAAVFVLTFSLAPAVFAQTNLQTDNQTAAQAKTSEKADKAQAKADKDERKAATSHKVRKADKQQDKADRDAAKAGKTPPAAPAPQA